MTAPDAASDTGGATNGVVWFAAAAVAGEAVVGDVGLCGMGLLFNVVFATNVGLARKFDYKTCCDHKDL